MTLAQNLQQPSSGNRTWFFFALFFLLISCGSQKLAKTEKPVSKTETTEEPSSIPTPGVQVITDNKSYKKAAKTTTVTFMGQQFKAAVSPIEEYRVAIVLPFCFGKGGKANEQLREVALEYFEGAELAIEELKARGAKLHVEVFDSQNDSFIVAQLLKGDYLKTVHLIIGPVFDKEFSLVEAHCSVYGIPLVNPLRYYTKTNRTSVPIFNPVSVDSNRHYLAAIQLLKHFSTSQFVFYCDGSQECMEAKRAFSKAFLENKKPLPIISSETLKSHIESNNDLIIIAPFKSDNKAHQLLNATAGKKNVQILAHEDWFDFPIIPFTLWEKNNLLFYNNNFVKQQESEVTLFNENYALKYGGVPGKFSYIAYDQALFFVEALTAFGPNFGEYLSGKTFPLIHNAFNFVYLNNDTYENRHVNLLRLVDFELVKIN